MSDERKIYEQIGDAMFFLPEYAYGSRNIEENTRPATKEEQLDNICKKTEPFTVAQELKKRLEGKNE